MSRGRVARRQERPRPERRTRVRTGEGALHVVIDAHFHQLPKALLDEVSEGRLEDVSLVSAGADGLAPALTFPRRPPVPLPPRIADLPAALAHLEAAGKDRAVVTPWASALGDTLRGAAAAAYAHLMNRHMAALARASGGRLVALGIVPTGAPEAVPPTMRAMAADGLRGVYMCTHMDDEPLDSARFAPVWTGAEELSLPVFLHPANVVETRLRRFNLANLLGNPMDTSIAAVTLMFGGVLDRHPKLRVVLSHGGGTLPYGVGRLDHGFYARRGGPLGSAEPPSAYLRRFYYDTVVYRPQSVAYLVDTVGADRVVLGTDFPFDMEMTGAADRVRSAVADPSDREAILHGTAEAVYGPW